MGSIALRPPEAGWLALGFAGVSIVAVLLLLLFGTYTRRELAQGNLVSSDGVISIKTEATGTVTRVLVKEGGFVHRGDALVEVSGEQSSVSLGNSREQVIRDLQTKLDKFKLDLAEQKSAFETTQSELKQRIESLRRQWAAMGAQLEIQRQRAASAEALYVQWKSLGNNGVVSRMQLLQQQDTALQNQSSLKEMERQRLDLAQQFTETQANLKRLPGEFQGKQNDTERSLADVRQALSEAQVLRALVLTASSDGTVTNLLVHPGDSVAAQQTVMTLLPFNSRLMAELLIPSRAAGFIKAGDRVVLQYDAFPSQKFGVHGGTIASVARTALLRGQLNAASDTGPDEGRYRVLVSLDQQTVLAYGQRASLRPGMSLTAAIHLDRRKLIDLIIHPFYELWGNATQGDAHG